MRDYIELKQDDENELIPVTEDVNGEKLVNERQFHEFYKFNKVSYKLKR